MTRLQFKGTRVDYPTARSRAWDALSPEHPKPAAVIACEIWPDANMKAQGAGGAASRILKKMEREGLARWIIQEHGDYRTWGWIRTGHRP